MVSNPIQRKQRNSLLVGLLIGLLIGLILCGAVYVLMNNGLLGESAKAENKKIVYVLNKSVKSGGTITLNDVTMKKMQKEDTPDNAVAISTEVIAKINLEKGTVLTSGMLTSSANNLVKDLREQEYNMIVLPTQLAAGDYIDIRLQLPNGGDYIVIAKKKVLRCTSNTIWINVSEDEIEILSNAIIEYYTMAGSKLYASLYTDPGIQEAATPTYCPNSVVAELLMNNPNVTAEIVDGRGRFSEKLKSIRNNNIKDVLNSYEDDKSKNIEGSIKDEIERLQESRESYFTSLNSMTN